MNPLFCAGNTDLIIDKSLLNGGLSAIKTFFTIKCVNDVIDQFNHATFKVSSVHSFAVLN